MTNKEQDNNSNVTLDLVNKFVESNQRKRINLLNQIESEVDNIFKIGPKLFQIFDRDGDDWAAGWLLQVLKKYKPDFFENSKFNNWFNTYSDIDINYEEMQLMLVEQNFEEADRLTSSYLRKLAGKLAENRGYVFYSEVKNMPGKDLQTQEVQYGSEPVRSMVQTHGYEGLIEASFYGDKYLRERQFFEAWQRMCVGEHTHRANYYDNYIGKMHIYQLGADQEINRDMPAYAIEAMEVYPTTIGTVNYSYAASSQIVKINVGFAYKYWRNLGTNTSSLEFGRTTQAPARVKARDRGIFGMLPPTLQRSARNVFSQGRTVWNPVGRIFNGKVFPPFT